MWSTNVTSVLSLQCDFFKFYWGNSSCTFAFLGDKPAPRWPHRHRRLGRLLRPRVLRRQQLLDLPTEPVSLDQWSKLLEKFYSAWRQRLDRYTLLLIMLTLGGWAGTIAELSKALKIHGQHFNHLWKNYVGLKCPWFCFHWRRIRLKWQPTAHFYSWQK